MVSVSIAPGEAAEFERIAGEEGRNRSELFREMLRVYAVWRETERFESLQRYGAARARLGGITTVEDVERLVRDER